ncbi:MAG: type II secretion system F family protein [Oliverpabstia sp.]|nr:type II secretion system F family protein [Oliverpabstia sp.]
MSFQDAATESEIFSGIYLRMIHIGFKTGAMDDVMREISIRYDEDIQEQMDRMVSRLEPTLVAILSIAVGMILLSVMLPLMGIMSNMG